MPWDIQRVYLEGLGAEKLIALNDSWDKPASEAANQGHAGLPEGVAVRKAIAAPVKGDGFDLDSMLAHAETTRKGR